MPKIGAQNKSTRKHDVNKHIFYMESLGKRERGRDGGEGREREREHAGNLYIRLPVFFLHLYSHFTCTSVILRNVYGLYWAIESVISANQREAQTKKRLGNLGEKAMTDSERDAITSTQGQTVQGVAHSSYLFVCDDMIYITYIVVVVVFVNIVH